MFKAITIKGVRGRRIFETRYKVIAMLETGLNLRRVTIHRNKVADFRAGFLAMRSGLSGKVVLDWTWSFQGSARAITGKASLQRSGRSRENSGFPPLVYALRAQVYAR